MKPGVCDFTFLRQFCVAFVCLLLIGCGKDNSSSCYTSSVIAFGADAISIQSILDSAVEKGLDGIIVYVDRDGSEPVSYFSGMQNRDNRLPMAPGYLFKIASASKLFIAVSATKLVHQQLIDLDDTLEFWLPAIASRIENGGSITIREMLMHRSGIPDFGHQAGFNWLEAHTDIDDTLEYALELPANFAPGSSYGYSNTNYLLIAKILDKALGKSHREYIQSEILSPLGMRDTYSTVAEVDRSRLIRGYWGEIDYTNLDYTIPGGSMVSTAADMAVFLRALTTGNLLNNAEKTSYSSLYRYNHSGTLPGFYSTAQFDEETNTIAIQFVNTTDGNAGGQALANIAFHNVLCNVAGGVQPPSEARKL